MSSRGQSLKLRKIAFDRDSGICVSCGADCEKIKRVYWAILDFEARVLYADVLGVTDEGRTFWDADHVIELADGGTNDAGNIQTLCMTCHKAKTRASWASRPAPPPAPAISPALISPAERAQIDIQSDDYNINVCGYLLWEKEPWMPEEMKGRLERARAQLKVHDDSFDVSDDYVSTY